MKRYNLIQALITRLQTITTANGYNYNPSIHYFFDLAQEYEDSNPLISIVDSTEAYEDVGLARHNTLSLELHILQPVTDPLLNSHNLLQDIIKCLEVDETLGGACLKLQLVSLEKDKQTEGRTVVMQKLTIDTSYRTGRLGN
jgi:hypothetical protein